MYVLALEASTSSAKAMLYHPETGETLINMKSYPDMNTVEQDPTIVYNTLCESSRELVEAHPDKEVSVVSLGGTWHSVLLCDDELWPTTPCYAWNYTGASALAQGARTNPDNIARYYNLTGGIPNASYPYFKLQLLASRGHRLWESRIMGQGSYIYYRLTGEHVSSESMVSGSGLMDITSKQYDPGHLADLSISEANLPKIVKWDYSAPITEHGAKRLGVKEGTPVLPAEPDGALNQVGSGGLRPGIMTMSVGTSGALRLSAPSPRLDPGHSVWCYLTPGEDAWLSGAATSGACSVLDWYRENHLPPNLSYSEMEKNVTPEMDTPVFLPFVFGERSPGWGDTRRGGFIGLKPNHTWEHMVGAVLEGALFNLKHAYQALMRVNDEPEMIVLSGGILNSPIWTQMAADILGRTLTPCAEKQNSLLGAALLGMQYLGKGKAVDYTPPLLDPIAPNTDSVRLYLEKFGRYLDAYKTGA